MAKQIPEDTEILAGLEMGGIPIATALSLETGIPVVFVRKKPRNMGLVSWLRELIFKKSKYV